MSNDKVKILNLIAEASSDHKIEQLLNVLIDDVSFDDVLKIRTVINERLTSEKTPAKKYNYWKALEFLD